MTSTDPQYINPTRQAVIWVKKAKVGSLRWVDDCTHIQYEYYKLLKQLKPLWQVSRYCLVILTFFEAPALCTGTIEQCDHADAYLYSMTYTVLPLDISAVVSVVCFLCLTLRKYLRKFALGLGYRVNGWIIFNDAVVLFGLCTSFAGLFVPWVYTASFICRPLVFLSTSTRLRRTSTIIFRSLPGFIDVLLTLILCVAVFVCVGMVLFRKTPEGHFDFPDWQTALAKMWILYTTANSPNVFMAAYNSNKFNVIFFIVYLIMTVYFLGNLVLARVYEVYKKMLADEVTKHKKHQQIAIDKAFAMLATHDDPQEFIDAETWRQFFINYCGSDSGGIQVDDKEDTEYNVYRGNLILTVFHGLDMESGVALTREQFNTVIRVFLDRDVYIAPRRPPKQNTHHSFMLDLQASLLNGFELCGMTCQWDTLMDVIILACCVLAVLQAVAFARPDAPPLIDTTLFWVNLPLTMMYIFEVGAKIVILGFARFWHRRPIQNRFDFINVTALFVVELLYLIHYRSEGMERAIILLNLARGFRLFVYILPFQHIFLVLTKLAPTYFQMGMVFIIIYYIFAVIGRWCFGGEIYSTNPVLAGSQFQQNNFMALNFNDFGSSLVTLFALMVVNNWYIIAGGYLLVSGTVWASAYFVSFYIICNLIVLNILMALIIDSISAFSDEVHQDEATVRRTSSMMHIRELERMASGLGGIQAETMLRKVLTSDEDLTLMNEGPEKRPLKTMSQPDIRRINYGTIPSTTREQVPTRNSDDSSVSSSN